MKKAWKIIVIIALCILILGEVVLGVGLLMQGSPETVWETAYENFNLGPVFEFIGSDAVQQPIQNVITWFQTLPIFQ